MLSRLLRKRWGKVFPDSKLFAALLAMLSFACNMDDAIFDLRLNLSFAEQGLIQKNRSNAFFSGLTRRAKVCCALWTLHPLLVWVC